jgi:putative hydrolase of the HAD superfamily
MKYLLLDVDGIVITGYHHNPAHRKLWNTDLKKDLGIEPDDLDRLLFAKHWQLIMCGEADTSTCIAEVLAQIGSPHSSETLIKYWLEHDSKLNQELLEKVHVLREEHDFTCCLATNQEHLRAKYLWDTLGLKNHFNEIFYSAALHCAKPDLRYFEIVADRLNANLARDIIFYFDDTPACVDAARQCGWEAKLFNTNADFIVEELLLHVAENSAVTPVPLISEQPVKIKAPNRNP